MVKVDSRHDLTQTSHTTYAQCSNRARRTRFIEKAPSSGTDVICLDIEDSLPWAEMAAARALGYRGKLVIHPTQVAIANRVFMPSEADVSEARVIVEVFERDGIAKGLAAIPLDGKMVDTPIYWRAKRLLEWAEQA